MFANGTTRSLIRKSIVPCLLRPALGQGAITKCLREANYLKKESMQTCRDTQKQKI